MQERTQNAVRKDKGSPQKRQQEDRAHSTAIHCASKMQFGEHQDSPTPIFSLTGTFDGPPRRQKEIGSFLLTRPSINGKRNWLITSTKEQGPYSGTHSNSVGLRDVARRRAHTAEPDGVGAH